MEEFTWNESLELRSMSVDGLHILDQRDGVQGGEW